MNCGRSMPAAGAYFFFSSTEPVVGRPMDTCVHIHKPRQARPGVKWCFGIGVGQKGLSPQHAPGHLPPSRPAKKIQFAPFPSAPSLLRSLRPSSFAPPISHLSRALYPSPAHPFAPFYYPYLPCVLPSPHLEGIVDAPL